MTANPPFVPMPPVGPAGLWAEGSRLQPITEADRQRMGFGWDEAGEPTRRHGIDEGWAGDPQPVDVDAWYEHLPRMMRTGDLYPRHWADRLAGL